MDNLPLLRDIHLPPTEHVFLLGIGWLYILAAAAVLFVLYRMIRRIYRKSRKRFALGLLEKCTQNIPSSAAQISEILRRICLLKEKKSATFFGRKWIDFLNDHASEKLQGDAVNLLLDAPYMPETEVFDAQTYDTLRRFAKKWIGENL
jgi:hypothetical protein